jgi:hypothetical protein
MQFKYDFERYGPDKIPFVDIIIENKDNQKTTGYRALLDSGAFMTVMHSEIADVLDIDLSHIKDEVAFVGIGKIKRQLKGKKYVAQIMVFQKGNCYKFDTYVLFSDDIPNDGHPILGRMGFFDRFNEVVFNYTSNKIYLIKK